MGRFYDTSSLIGIGWRGMRKVASSTLTTRRVGSTSSSTTLVTEGSSTIDQ